MTVSTSPPPGMLLGFVDDFTIGPPGAGMPDPTPGPDMIVRPFTGAPLIPPTPILGDDDGMFNPPAPVFSPLERLMAAATPANSQAQIDAEINAQPAPGDIKQVLIAAQAEVWGDDGLPATVTTNLAGEITLTETGAAFTASLTVGEGGEWLGFPPLEGHVAQASLFNSLGNRDEATNSAADTITGDIWGDRGGFAYGMWGSHALGADEVDASIIGPAHFANLVVKPNR